MDYLQNHCWCSDSNWGGHYDCRHIVSIHSQEQDDWQLVINPSADSYEDLEEYGRIKDIVEQDGSVFKMKPRVIKVPNLNSNVLDWLNQNVPDIKKPYSNNLTTKAWAIGSIPYRKNCYGNFTVFFQRKKDAMAFIRYWSKWKKPVMYTQYFTDVRKVLDLKTLKYTDR